MKKNAQSKFVTASFVLFSSVFCTVSFYSAACTAANTFLLPDFETDLNKSKDELNRLFGQGSVFLDEVCSAFEQHEFLMNSMNFLNSTRPLVMLDAKAGRSF